MSPVERRLGVWFEARRVGDLILDASRRMAFCYDSAWLEDGFEISHSLPLNETGDFLPPDMRGHFFFSNLLPEGDARHRLVRALGIADDDFALLTALGGDCAGALQLLPEGVEPEPGGDASEPLDEADIINAIESGSAVFPRGGRQAPRLSLAGAQDKIAVRMHDGEDARLALPVGQGASTHILKLPVRDLRHVPLYESYTTFMAVQLGLDVAPVTPFPIGKHICSISERYDRYRDEAGRVQRLHQEDFCQALGRSSARKYADEGATLADMAAVIRAACEVPALDLRNLVRWQIGNVLLGNADAHLKNLSLLRPRHGRRYRLAPCYDLICTQAIRGISHRLALPVGQLADPGLLRRTHWEVMAAELGVGKRLVVKTALEMAEQLHAGLSAWHAAFMERFGEHAVLQRVQQKMTAQAKRALRDW